MTRTRTLLALLATLPLTAFGAEAIPAGFIPSYLVLAPTPATVGTPARLYAVLSNSSELDITGTLRFEADKTAIGTAPFLLPHANIVQVWVDWTPTTPGTHTLAARFENTRGSRAGEASHAITLAQTTGVPLTVTAEAPRPITPPTPQRRETPVAQETVTPAISEVSGTASNGAPASSFFAGVGNALGSVFGSNPLGITESRDIASGTASSTNGTGPLTRLTNASEPARKQTIAALTRADEYLASQDGVPRPFLAAASALLAAGRFIAARPLPFAIAGILLILLILRTIIRFVRNRSEDW